MKLPYRLGVDHPSARQSVFHCFFQRFCCLFFFATFCSATNIILGNRGLSTVTLFPNDPTFPRESFTNFLTIPLFLWRTPGRVSRNKPSDAAILPFFFLLLLFFFVLFFLLLSVSALYFSSFSEQVFSKQLVTYYDSELFWDRERNIYER